MIKKPALRYLLCGIGAILLIYGLEVMWAGMGKHVKIGLMYTKVFVGIVTLGFMAFSIKNTILINLFFLLFFLFFGEVIFVQSYNKMGMPSLSYGGTYIGYFFEDHLDLGYYPRPSNQVSAVRYTDEGDTLYHVHYSVDSLSRRNIGRPISPAANRFAAFFGGSFVFGEGLNDEETMPSLFVEANTDYAAYNYGFCGYGTNQLLSLMESKKLPKEIPYKQGVAVYVFIWDHLIRTIGSMNCVTTFSPLHPHYRLEGDSIVRDGSFASAGFVERYEKMKWRKKLGLDYPARLKEEHYEFVAKVIEKSYRLFKEQFPDAEFCLMIYPGEENKIASYVDQTKIKVLDYSKMFAKNEHRVWVNLDHHPNAKGNQIVINKLTEDLKKMSSLAY